MSWQAEVHIEALRPCGWQFMLICVLVINVDLYTARIDRFVMPPGRIDRLVRGMSQPRHDAHELHRPAPLAALQNLL